MDDPIPLLATIVSGGALAVGIAAESALHNYSHSKLEKSIEGDDRASQVIGQLKHFDHFAQAISLFNTVMTVLFVGSVFIWRHGAGGWNHAIGTFVIVATILGFGYGILRSVVAHLAETVLLRLLRFIVVIGRIMIPLSAPVEGAASVVGRWFGARPDGNGEDEAVEEILDAVAEGEAEGVLQQTAADYIENIIEFKDSVVRDVMTPRTSMVCAKNDAQLADIVKLVRESGHSRIPTFTENRDNITGIVYVKDVLSRIEEIQADGLTIAVLAREPLFVPETKKISDLLKEFQEQQIQIAIVLDEFGGTAGLVTAEDIVEEIVGEIRDVFDAEEDVTHLHRVDDQRVEADAKIPVDELNERLGIDIPVNGDYETVGGFLSARLGKVPQRGESLEADGVVFEVMDADERKVKRVRITTSAVSQ